MSILVVDCSVTIPWGFGDQSTPYTDAALDAVREGSALMPALWAIEVSNVLAANARRGIWDDASIGTFRALLSRLPIRLEAQPQERALGQVLLLATRNRISAYDSAYLEVAQRYSLPLAAQDDRLRRAAAKSGVALFAG